MPFSLAYETEAATPEMLIQTERVAMVCQEDSEETLRLDLTLSEEKHDLAGVRTTSTLQA